MLAQVRKISIFILLFLSSTFLIFGQKKTVHFQQLSTEQGLSRSSVKAIIQDAKGYIWVGTEYGVNRYDGYHFKTYTYNPEDSNSLAGNHIRALMLDSKGRLWLGADGGGLSLYHEEYDHFENFRHDPDDEQTLKTDHIYDIFEDHEGFIWISTKRGLNILNPNTKKIKRIPFEKGTPNSTASKYIKKVYQDRDGDLWVISDSGISKIILGKTHLDVTFKHYPAGENTSHSLPNKYAKGMIQDQKDRIWVITDGGLSQFNKNTETFINYVHLPNNPNSPSNNYLKAIAEDQSGNIWIGADKGISVFNPATKQFIHYSHNVNNPNSLSNNYVKSIFVDPTGTIWIGTDGGLNIYDAYARPFQLITHQTGNKNSLISNCVYTVVEDNATGLVYAGTNAGLDQWDRDKNTFTHYLKGKSIKGLFIDNQHMLWVGTDNGLYRTKLNGSSLQFKQYRHDPSNPNSLCNNAVVYITEDTKGFVWISTYGNGICSFDRQTGHFTSYHKPLISSSQIRFLIPDQQGQYWAGSGDLDIISSDLSNSTQFSANEEAKRLLNQSIVNTMYEDENGILWFGSGGSGLLQYNPKDGSLNAYTTENGLPSNVIQSIVGDGAGNYWLGSNKGISLFNSRTNTFRNFSNLDGLQGDEFNYNAIYRSQQGEVFFGGLNGLNILSPNRLKQNTYLPPVHITALYVKNQLQKVTSSKWLPQSISTLKEITIPSSEKILKFEFVAPSYRNPMRNKYAYKLSPFQDDWAYTDAQRRDVTYTNLSPGTYTLHVRASNNDGVWNENGAQLSLIIKPAWWQTNAAKIGLIAAIIAIFYLFFSIRTRMLKRQKAVLEQQVHERTLALQKQKDEILTQNEELSQQAEEIAAQRDQIEEQHQTLGNLFNDMSVVGEVGKKITNSFDLETIFETVYHHLNQVVNAPTFGIGVFNEITNSLDFTEIDGLNKKVSRAHDSLDDTQRLSVKCFIKNEEIIIHDVYEERDKYGLTKELLAEEKNQSVVYLPLTTKDKKVGVLTVQSTKTHAYDTRQLNIIKTLSSYIGVALDNTHAYHIIKNKNKLITDSIRYAQTIQQAILPSNRQLNAAFADYFVLFKPKDIVSGDFYWHMPITENGTTKHYLAVVDCTGHGVPGAFMSMIGSRILNEVLIEKGIRKVNDILELIDQSVRVALQQDLEQEGLHTNTDGMDLGLIMIEQLEGKALIQFSGAKTSLFYQNAQQISRIKGDRRSIGGHQWSTDPFTLHELTLAKDTNIYITTDGILHQNDPNRKKFGRMQLVSTLEKTINQSMAYQKETLEQLLLNHQANMEQRDDITVMGIKL